MAAFPNDNPCPRVDGSKDTKSAFNKRADFQANYSQISPKTTRGRRRFELNYDSITFAEFNTLEALFDNKGQIYTFEYSGDGGATYTTYNVYIDQDELAREFVSSTRCSTSIILQEV